MEIKGTIIEIFNEVIISEKFKKREFVIKTEDQYPQEIIIQATNTKCALLDAFLGGEKVNVHINIRGRGFTKKDGSKGYMNSVECWKIEQL